jgi:hypothetical protein
VKIKGTCKRDGRDFFVEQVVSSGGKCPWDGEPFNADYAVTLVRTSAMPEKPARGSRLPLGRSPTSSPSSPSTKVRSSDRFGRSSNASSGGELNDEVARSFSGHSRRKGARLRHRGVLGPREREHGSGGGSLDARSSLGGGTTVSGEAVPLGEP